MTNHTLEKPNDWWQLHFTFGIHLKFGPNSHHKTKGRPSSLHREREHPKLHANYTHSHREGPPTGLVRVLAVATAGGRMKAHDGGDFLSTTEDRGQVSTD